MQQRNGTVQVSPPGLVGTEMFLGGTETCPGPLKSGRRSTDTEKE